MDWRFFLPEDVEYMTVDILDIRAEHADGEQYQVNPGIFSRLVEGDLVADATVWEWRESDASYPLRIAEIYGEIE